MTGGRTLACVPSAAAAAAEPGSTGRWTTSRSFVDLTMVQPLLRAAPMARPFTSDWIAPGINICGRLPISQLASDPVVGVLAQPLNAPIANTIDPRVARLLNFTEIPRALKTTRSEAPCPSAAVRQNQGRDASTAIVARGLRMPQDRPACVGPVSDPRV